MENRRQLVVNIEQAVDGGYWCCAEECVCDSLLVGSGDTISSAKEDLYDACREVREMLAEQGKDFPEIDYVFKTAAPLRKFTLQVIRGKSDGSYDINLAADDLDYSIFATGKDFESAKEDFFHLYDEMRASYEEMNKPFEDIVVEFGEEVEE